MRSTEWLPALNSTWEGRSGVSPSQSCGSIQTHRVSGTEALRGPHPHSWRSSRRLNFLLALRWVEGQRGVSAPTLPPSSGFLLETDCAASSSHHCHRPSHHHACLFPWAWLSLPAKIPLYPLVLGPSLGVEGRLGRDFKSNDPDALSGMAVLGPVEGLLESAERTSKRER